MYVDNVYVASISNNSSSYAWDTTSAANGVHTVTAKGKNSSSVVVATDAINLTVANGVTQPSSTPTAQPSGTATPQPTSTSTAQPTATPTPSGNGISYFVSPSGSDSSAGTSTGAAWKTLAKARSALAGGQVHAGDRVLFARGGTWSEELVFPSGVNGAPGNPITIGNYGSGALPVIDGGSTRATCFSAVYTSVSYITIDGFECRNTTLYGMNFNDSGSSPMRGIVIQNNYVHNTGPGACAGCGTPHDPGGYNNQINYEMDGGGGPGGVKILNNTVNNCGGHNCLQVHGDTGSPLVQGNVVGPGCIHNCIDLKGVVGALVDQNTVTCPNCGSLVAAFYNENPLIANNDVTWTRNVAYQVPIALQIESGVGGGWVCAAGSCAMREKIYNNSFYVAPGAYNIAATSCSFAPMSFDIRNNILDGGGVSMHSGCSITWDYNDDGGAQGFAYASINGGTLVQALHDLMGINPSYVSAASGDLHLQANSPVLNMGLPGLTSVKNMGAY
jgi:hypothetical protein